MILQEADAEIFSGQANCLAFKFNWRRPPVLRSLETLAASLRPKDDANLQ